MHPLFPYIAGALVCLAFLGLAFAVSSALAFRDETRAWQSGAEARAVRQLEKLQDAIGAAEVLARNAAAENHRQDVALERQASELMQHRLSAPPPRLFESARRRVETSPDWSDDARATVIRPSSPPPLPAFTCRDVR